MSLVPSSPQAPHTVIQGPDPATWARHRQTITRLYIHENKCLEDIMEFMSRNYDFHATQRMFKFRIKGWKLNKSLRPDEVLAMARVKARRESAGKGADFWRYGRPVTPAKLERYLRDHPHTAAQLTKHVSEDVLREGHIEALLPAHIVALTPSPALKLDEDMHSLEGLVATLDYYMRDRCSNSNNSEINHDFAPFRQQIGFTAYTGLREAACLLNQSHCQPQYRKVANSMLQSSFDELQSAVDTEHPGLIWAVLFEYINCDRPEIATLWLSLARDYCITVKGSSHPLSTAFSLFLQWRESHMQSKAISLICRVVQSSVSKIFRCLGSVMSLFNFYSWDIFDIIHRNAQPFRTKSFNAEYWTKRLESTPQRFEVIYEVIAFLLAPDPDGFEFVLDWLELSQWRETSWLSDTDFYAVSNAYLEVGDVKMALETLRDFFSCADNDWQDGQWQNHTMLGLAQEVDYELKRFPRETDGLETLQDRVQVVWNQALEELAESIEEVQLSDED